MNNLKQEEEKSVPPYLVIMGPTASGKSALSMKLAEHYNGEIIACDSVQIYKDFNIGSAKPSQEDQVLIPHHMIDILRWHEEFDANQYAQKAKKTIEQIWLRKKLPILVVGTGLYYRALCRQNFHDLPSHKELRERLKTYSKQKLTTLLYEKDPKRAKMIHPNDHYRLARALEVFYITGKTFDQLAEQKTKNTFLPQFTIAIDISRKELHNRIEQRANQMIESGFEDEVKQLLKSGCLKSCKPMNTIGYQQLKDHCPKKPFSILTLQSILAATRQYAKRQTTWFKKMERDMTVSEHTTIDHIIKAIDTSNLIKIIYQK
ncbi:MAG: tRNA (adenosine(37)-N6)-dimethylallyltransferase MiaA [Zetaproteobacteria bacterium]|nr:tRNA (adenosine(37)-N6)-dimethylallyltransferase MiaA [Pseudobdellovibrionaceae bacterium]